jgi:SulP family sulfate permease
MRSWGSRPLAAKLPDPAGSRRAAVVLRLRGRSTLGVTFFRVIGEYADLLGEHDGRLYLSGLSPQVLYQLRTSGILRISGPVLPFPASDIVGASTAKAVDAAENWLVERGGVADHAG